MILMVYYMKLNTTVNAVYSFMITAAANGRNMPLIVILTQTIAQCTADALEHVENARMFPCIINHSGISTTALLMSL
jgi:hypothetical protein